MRFTNVSVFASLRLLGVMTLTSCGLLLMLTGKLCWSFERGLKFYRLSWHENDAGTERPSLLLCSKLCFSISRYTVSKTEQTFSQPNRATDSYRHFMGGRPHNHSLGLLILMQVLILPVTLLRIPRLSLSMKHWSQTCRPPFFFWQTAAPLD